MNFRTRTVSSKDFTLSNGEDVTVEFTHTPSLIMDYNDFITVEKDDKLIVGYLSDDSDCDNPLEDCEYMGYIYSAHRDSGQHKEMQEALGLDSDWQPNLDLVDEGKFEELEDFAEDNDQGFDEDVVRLELWKKGRENGTIGNPYAVSLDVYEHSGISYSVSGEGMQCIFDTSNGGAVFVPDDGQLKHIKGCKDPHKAAIELAKTACDQYTKWLNSDCYGIVVEVFDLKGSQLSEDSCWGFIGSDYAMEELGRRVKEEAE